MKRPKKDNLIRAIEAKERSVANSKREINDIRATAEKRVAKVQKNIAKQNVLLAALRSGELKP